MSSTAKPRPSAVRRSTGTGESGEMIVTRGLQEMLDAERQRGSVGAPKPSAKASKRRGASGAVGNSTGPNFVICYLCGRQFGSASVGIHRPQCYLKRMIQWERGDAAIRGPRPVDPDTHEKQLKARIAGGGGGRPIDPNLSKRDAYNAAQFEAFNETALAPCPNCARTFLADRLQIHLRSCKPGATCRPVGRRNPAATSAGPTAVVTASSAPRPVGRASPLAAASPVAVVDQPIRASGGYHYDPAAGAEDVPPGADKSGSAIPARGPSQVAKGMGASRRSVCGKRSSPGATVVVGAAKGYDSNSDDDSISIEMVETDDYENCTEASPISPTAAEPDLGGGGGGGGSASTSAGAATDGSAVGERGGTSVPARHASMDPSHSDAEATTTDPSNGTNGGGNVAPGLTFNITAGSRANSKSALAETGGSRRSPGGLPTAQERRRMAQENAARNSGGYLAEEDGDNSQGTRSITAAAAGGAGHRGSGGSVVHVVEAGRNSEEGGGAAASGDGEDDEDADTPTKKIPLNNVSRFKNVQSRLKMDRQAAQTSLSPCGFCGRNFDPVRVAKHESVCIERNKAPAAVVNRTHKAPAAGAAAAAKRPVPSATRAAAAPAPRAAKAPTASMYGFCTDCGAQRVELAQKFCADCGCKCPGL